MNIGSGDLELKGSLNVELRTSKGLGLKVSKGLGLKASDGLGNVELNGFVNIELTGSEDLELDGFVNVKLNISGFSVSCAIRETLGVLFGKGAGVPGGGNTVRLVLLPENLLTLGGLQLKAGAGLEFCLDDIFSLDF